MFITVDQEDRRPIYQQVADGIKDLIARGELKEGMELPPVRQLAIDLGVNLNTVATAYRELGQEGLISVRHGLRAVVASRTVSSPPKNDDELRKPIRAALTQLVLSGLPKTEIKNIVTDELHALLKGVK
ncbi:MAG TPA: GntR family transcriptional regulator [Blastocatellia bacterium]|nr:GntR family transcriptional regulator [Blastocatellia bacterium]